MLLLAVEQPGAEQQSGKTYALEINFDRAALRDAYIRKTADALQIRSRIIRKDRAVGMISGGADAKSRVPDGSGSRRIRRELLDEAALRLQVTHRRRSSAPRDRSRTAVEVGRTDSRGGNLFSE